MKLGLFVIAMLSSVLGCGLSNVFNGTNTDSNAVRVTPTVDVMPSRTPTPKSSSSPAKEGVIDVLRKSKGKYPANIKLLDVPDLNARLKKLLGSQFASMKKYWNVESPIEIDNDVVMTSGCEAHNCGANRYLLFVDLKKDNLNVFHQDDGKYYFENGAIKLPPKFASEVGSDQ